METEVLIERFVLQQLPQGDDVTKLELDEPLISTGIMDSFMLLRLIVFIEESFGIAIEDRDLIPENFQTIRQIKALIENKQ
jgi:acyl carrier protein